MMKHNLNLPLTKEKAAILKSGDTVYLSGTIFTARDAAHKKMLELLKKGQNLPFEMQNATIYYVGPTPAKPGHVIGSAGPTTSYRMDAYTKSLLQKGLMGIIGKGHISQELTDEMQKTGAVYFGAIGGAGALLATCVKESKIIAFEELGPEAVHKLVVQNLPTVVIIDTKGQNLYTNGKRHYLKSL